MFGRLFNNIKSTIAIQSWLVIMRPFEWMFAELQLSNEMRALHLPPFYAPTTYGFLVMLYLYPCEPAKIIFKEYLNYFLEYEIATFFCAEVASHLFSCEPEVWKRTRHSPLLTNQRSSKSCPRRKIVLRIAVLSLFVRDGFIPCIACIMLYGSDVRVSFSLTRISPNFWHVYVYIIVIRCDKCFFTNK